MPENITNKTLFHVTTTRPYSQELVLGQSLRIGEAPNPFFGFYENPRQYPVTQGDGTVVQVRALALIKQARDGQINCPQLTIIAAEVTQHYVMFVRELLMEEVRIANYVQLPSRQRCLWVCETEDEARFWKQRLGDVNAKICSLTATGITHRADASLLSGDSEPISVIRERSHKYWRGEASDRPEWETLFVGNIALNNIVL